MSLNCNESQKNEPVIQLTDHCLCIILMCTSWHKILPLEVKAGVNPKSKSLQSFGKKYNPSVLVRTTLLNLKREDRVINIPLYAIAGFPGLCQ